MDKICIYLRKSRADEELEKELGQGETLAKHRKTLLKYAQNNKLNIIEIKEEIVSGDSLFFRPKMLELLKEVENNQYNGVLVMDIDRLGRGGMKDQGIILEAFKESHTLIITPSKTYDLNNDADEEMTEFKTFFARRELKVINKRMQGGRLRSVQEGNYISTNPPLGYDITFIKKSRTLKINESEAEIIKLIFNMYVKGNGASHISSYLNSLGYKSKNGNEFSPSSVLFILKNPVYIGKVTWKKKDIRKSKDPNKVKDTKTRPKDEWIISDGKHKPIINIDLFNKAQNIINSKYHIPYQLHNAPVNPVAGIVKCGICGKAMVMRKIRGINRIMCINKCGNMSIRFDIFEQELINSLKEYLQKYKFTIKVSSENDNKSALNKQRSLLQKESTTLQNQKNKLYDFLERGIYSEDVFLQRSNNLDERIKIVSNQIEELDKKINTSKISKSDIQNFENILTAYEKSNDISNKNILLKSILYKVEYIKDKKGNDFEIKIYPKLLK